MTVHASKGLEFKQVFVTGLEDGLFPHERRAEDSPASAQGYGEAQEEERRLFYVAVTRERKIVFILCKFSYDFRFTKYKCSF